MEGKKKPSFHIFQDLNKLNSYSTMEVKLNTWKESISCGRKKSEYTQMYIWFKM